MKTSKLTNILSLILFLSIIGGSFSSNNTEDALHAEKSVNTEYSTESITDSGAKHDFSNLKYSEDTEDYGAVWVSHEKTVDYPGGSGPVAYLTFDDGPSKNTVAILDILAQHLVRATFFVLGNNSSGYDNIYWRIMDEGHAIGNHTYSHHMNEIYSSVDAFISDLIKMEDLLFAKTGMKTNMMRFPGGSSLGRAKNIAGYDIMGELIEALEERGYDYFDWNVDSRDGIAVLEPREIVNNVINQVDEIEGDIIILLHDSPRQKSTVEALPEIIEQLDARGYEFLPLSPGAVDIKHR